MPAAKELIGHNRTDKEIAEAIGADWLIYQDLDDLIEAVKKKVPAIKQFDTSVFNGEYVTGDISKEYLARIEASRSDDARKDKVKDNEVVEIYNTA